MLQNIRALHVLRAPTGGLFRHVRDLVAGQAAAGMAVGIICDSQHQSPRLTEELAQLQAFCRLGVHRIPMKRLPATSDLHAIREVRRIAREARAEVLHGHGAKGGAYARLAARGMGAARPKTVYTPHGGSLHYNRLSLSGAAFLTLEQLLLAHTDQFIFVCGFERDEFCAKVGRPRSAVTIAYNGVRPDEISPVFPADDAADLLFIGELRRLKGVDLLLDAMAVLNDRPQLTACIVGAGSDGDAFKAQAAKLGLGDRVRFPGAMPARDAFRHGKLLVIPSRAESLPYIVLEALAASTPLIASRVGGVPEILEGHEDLMFSPGKVDCLAAAIDDALGDLERRRVIAGQLSRRIASRFSVDAMVDTIMRSYVTLLNKPDVSKPELIGHPSAAL